MKMPSGSRTFITRLVFSLVTGIALAALAATADAKNKPPVPPLGCSIMDPGDIVINTPVNFTAMLDGGATPYKTVHWSFSWRKKATPNKVEKTDVEPGAVTATTTFTTTGSQNIVLTVKDQNKKTCKAILTVAVVGELPPPFTGVPTARGDTYATPIGKELTVGASRVSGLLYNDFDTDPDTGENLGNAGLTVVQDSDPAHGAIHLHADGSFTYTPDGTQGDNDNDSFTYHVVDSDANSSDVAIVNIHITADQPDFKILMNYELGMHCTGFEFSYCCVLPPYNSIVAQVVKSQTPGFPTSNADYPRLLTADPVNGLDGLGRETVLRDYDSQGNFNKYFLEYRHDIMPRLEGNMPDSFNSSAGKDTLISAVEGNSLLYWNTPYDSAQVDTDGSITGVPGKLVTGTYAGEFNVVLGDGSFQTPCLTGPDGCTDNFANGWLNHFYIYQDLEGSNPTDTSLEIDKMRLGVANMVEYPADSGAALQPMGPTGNGTPFQNVLTFSGDTGTVVYTQMKVLENLPIMLTAPKIWEALGLPLTPFEDSIDFFADPGAVDEDTIRPFVAMKAQLFEANCDESTGDCTKGDAVMSNGRPVLGFGSAPIDIPNCERCHSAPAYQADGVTPNVNSPAYTRRQDGPDPYFGPAGETLEAMTDLETNYWKAFYDLDTSMGDTDWYARLKGAAISIEVMHDFDNGTNFTANYPTSGLNPDGTPEPPNDELGLPADKAMIMQNTRMGHESVICQKCHADNVIAVVKSANIGASDGPLVPPISEAIHNAHRANSAGGVIVFNDALGRFGGCQGCHPAHRSDGVMDNYPITIHGDNVRAESDNRLGAGGCFVGRDVHSNPLKDVDGAETPEHLNAVGQWLKDNVARNQAGLGNSDEDYRGIWCTNCHTQLSQELWRTEDCNDLIHGDCLVNPRAAGPNLSDVAAAVGLTEQQAINYLDPKNPDVQPAGVPQVTEDDTHAAWDPLIDDANVATIEVSTSGPDACAPLTGVFNATFGVDVCVSLDGDGDPSVNILTFCTTDDCVAQVNNAANRTVPGSWRYPEAGTVDGVAGFAGTGTVGAAVPFSAADDARDHWLSAGEPHCADCHAAPYTEQSGNINPFPPFNYPAKAGLNRYSFGHQGISCQGCHESIHGLYPVGPAIDNTTYAQAAALNADGSHGPLKCATCHTVNSDGIPSWISPIGDGAVGNQINGSFDNAVTWAHTYTAEANVLNTTCQNCHGVDGNFDPSSVNTNSVPADWTKVASHEPAFLQHSFRGYTSRLMMDNAETLVSGSVDGTTDGSDGVCVGCHINFSNGMSCTTGWKQHLTQGRVAESVWEQVSEMKTGTLCGW
jgi:Bacterial Ig domain